MPGIEAAVFQSMNDLTDHQESGVANIVMDVAQPRFHHILPRVAQDFRLIAAVHEGRPQQPPVQGQHGGHEDGMRTLHILGKDGRVQLRRHVVIRNRC